MTLSPPSALSHPRFGRLLVAMVTPFLEDGRIDIGRAVELATELVNRGADGLVLVGTTGENPTISRDEERELFEHVIHAVGKRASIVLNVGGNDTDENVRFVESLHLSISGADAIMAVAPYYNKPTQLGMYLHFCAIAAAATPAPVILYNVPSRTGVSIEVDTVVRLANDVPNIVAIKDAPGDVTTPENQERIARLWAETPPRFEVISGDDSATLAIARANKRRGMHWPGSVISVAGNVLGVTEMMAEMLAAERDRDTEKADAINARLAPLFSALFCVSNPIPVKYAMEQVGFPVGDPKLPMTSLRDEDADRGTTFCQEMEEMLTDLGLGPYPA